MALNTLYFVLAQTTLPTEEPVMSPMQFILHTNVINFLLVAFFLVWIIRKFHIFSVISDRQNEIARKIKLAEEEKLRAEMTLEATKKKIRRSDQEAEKIAKDAQEVAVSLAGRIRKEADIESEDMKIRAKRILEVEKAMASSEVTKNISYAAFAIAEEHVKKSIDDRLQQKYMEEFIDSLDNLKV